MQQDYLTPAGPSEAVVEEKKSEFIAALAPVATEEEALAFLEQRRAAHRTARHHVYAYVLRQDGRTRYSDDGEPAKTAGLPVLGVIQHGGLFDVIIVVTRYFGGTLLGTGGLVRAYTAAAQAAVEKADIMRIRRVRRIALQLAYPMYEPVQRLLDEAGARLCAGPDFGADVRLEAFLPEEEAAGLAARLEELLRGGQGMAVSEGYFAPF